MEKHPMKLKELEKSSSSVATNEERQSCVYIPMLHEEGPVGLKLNKSPSLLELIQKRVSQERNENLQVGNAKKKVKPAAGAFDKLKASNFAAESLTIGNWEYASKREGDLVAKFYFAKHKLVWELLYDGLKNKIEIQWEDIVALKANCPENGPASLTVVLGKQPLFFRETNPQPRKHTLWQATSDFTNGNATTYRQHHLQCAHDVLNKHYEKLIHCDTRLNFLSQQSYPVLDLPNVSRSNSIMPSTNAQTSVLNTEELGALASIRDLMKDSHLQNLEVSPTIQQTMPISNLVNHVGHIENLLGEDNQKDITNDISHILQSMPASASAPATATATTTPTYDPTTLMSRVETNDHVLRGGNDYSNPDSNKIPEEKNDHVSGYRKALGLSRKDSFTDFLHQLPGTASLPSFLCDSDDDEI